MLGIFETPVLVVFRSHLSYDRVFETRLLKGNLPVVDTLDDIWHPHLRRSGVDIIDDRFHRFDGVTQYIPHNIFRLRFKTPAFDVAHGFYSLWIGSVVEVTFGKI